VLRPVVKRADELLGERELVPLPAGVTPHKLRHTFASILIALGHDPAYVMGQLGHTDPKFTLRVYTHAMRRGPDERDRALVGGRSIGSKRQQADGVGPLRSRIPDGRGGFRTCDLSRVKRALSH
jgi:hypothetical protein